MFEMTHDLEYMWLKRSKNRMHKATIFQQKSNIMKQRADVADTLTITIKLLQRSYTTTPQCCHWIVEKLQMHEDAEKNTLRHTHKKKNRLEITQPHGTGGLMGGRWGILFLGHSFKLSISVCGKHINKTIRPWEVASEVEPRYFSHPVIA